MNDHTDDIDQADRIRRLQARRAAAAGDRRPVAVTSNEPAGAGSAAARSRQPKPRRRHPAAATRWLLGGLSIASFFGIAGTVAVANVSTVAAPATATAPTPAANSTSAPATPAAAKASSATSTATSTAQTPHTTTRGS